MAAAAPPDPAAACDGPGWRVASASVDGAPAGFDAGDAGRTYLWHDDGWHLRTTDVNNAPHLYTGTISASPGATSVDVHKIRLDPANHLWGRRPPSPALLVRHPRGHRRHRLCS